MSTRAQTPARGTKGKAPHRRDEDARLAVLHAADDLLAERGFGGVTVEGIAARAGVAKQTIYRWWPSKVDVLFDTLLEDAEGQLAVPDRGTAVQNTRAYVRKLARFMTKDPAGRVLLALMGEAQHDGKTGDLFRQQWVVPQRERERELLRRGVDSGELSPEIDIDFVLDALCGPVYMRALFDQPISRRFVDELVDANLGPHLRSR